MSDWTIRECRAEEAEAVLAMWREAGASPSVTDSVADIRRAILDSPARFLVAEAQGRLIGSVIGSFDGWRANFYRLAVIPAYRRRGLARALVTEIEAWLIQQGAKKIGALVENDRPGSLKVAQLSSLISNRCFGEANAVGPTREARRFRVPCVPSVFSNR